MHAAFALLLTFGLGALGQTTTVDIPLFGGTQQEYFEGSVVAVSGTDTTYALVCTSGVASVCDKSLTITATAGPSNWNVASGTSIDGASATVSESCTLPAASTGICTILLSASADGELVSTSLTSTWTGTDVSTQQVKITAGAEKLSASATATSTGAAPTSGVGEVVKVLVPMAIMAAGALV